jgi:hypothetical protein
MIFCFGSKTVLTAPKRHFRFAPINGHHSDWPQWTLATPIPIQSAAIAEFVLATIQPTPVAMMPKGDEIGQYRVDHAVPSSQLMEIEGPDFAVNQNCFSGLR